MKYIIVLFLTVVSASAAGLVGTSLSGGVAGSAYGQQLINSQDPASARATLGIAATNQSVLAAVGINSAQLSTNAGTLSLKSGGSLGVMDGSQLTGIIAANIAPYLVLPNVDASLATNLTLPTQFAQANTFRLPPMGFNTWYNINYNIYINQSNIVAMMDAMLTNGAVAVGYTYMNLDDDWQGTRDGSGNLDANTTQFPNGLAYLANYAHAQGMKFGVYTTYGPTTCDSRVGSAGHLYQDATNWSAKGVDYIKIEMCSGTFSQPFGRWSIEQMLQGILDSKRPVFLNVSSANMEFNGYKPWFQGEINSWRSTQDWGYWNATWKWEDMLHHFDTIASEAPNVGPGHFSDGDILQTLVDADFMKTEMSLWSIMSAPLLWTDFLWGLYPSLYTIQTNSAVIAIDQDPLVMAASLVSSSGSGQVWSKNLTALNSGMVAVCLLNRDTNNPVTLSVNWTNVGIPLGTGAFVQDLWNGTNFFATNTFSFTLPKRSCMLYKITAVQQSVSLPVTEYVRMGNWDTDLTKMNPATAPSPWNIGASLQGTTTGNNYIEIVVPSWVTNVIGTYTVQGSQDTSWTCQYTAFSFIQAASGIASGRYYSAGPWSSNIVVNAANGPTNYSFNLPFSPGNSLLTNKVVRMTLGAGTNTAGNRVFVGPMVLTYQ